MEVKSDAGGEISWFLQDEDLAFKPPPTCSFPKAIYRIYVTFHDATSKESGFLPSFFLNDPYHHIRLARRNRTHQVRLLRGQ